MSQGPVVEFIDVSLKPSRVLEICNDIVGRNMPNLSNAEKGPFYGQLSKLVAHPYLVTDQNILKILKDHLTRDLLADCEPNVPR